MSTRYDLRDLPEGWSCDPEDRSVGIFGDAHFHEACSGESAEAVVDERFVRYEGSRGNRLAIYRRILTCPECQATASYTFNEYDPEEVEDEDA